MAWWKALMIPITEDSSEPNGFGAIAISDRSPRILSSFTIGIIATAASKVKHPFNLSRSRGILPSCPLQGSHYPKLTISQTEQFLSSVLSEATGNSISLGSILNSLKNSSTLTFGLKSSRVCIKFKFIWAMSWLPLFHTVYPHGSLQILQMGNLCIDTS